MSFRLSGWLFLTVRLRYYELQQSHFFAACCCENVVSVRASRAGGSLRGLSGLSPSARSECQCIPAGPGDVVGVMPFMLNWVTNPTNMIVNILKGIPWHFDLSLWLGFIVADSCCVAAWASGVFPLHLTEAKHGFCALLNPLIKTNPCSWKERKKSWATMLFPEPVLIQCVSVFFPRMTFNKSSGENLWTLSV